MENIERGVTDRCSPRKSYLAKIGQNETQPIPLPRIKWLKT